MLLETPVFGDVRPQGNLRLRRNALTNSMRLCAVWEGLRGRDLVLNRALLVDNDPTVNVTHTAGLMGPAGKTTATTQFWTWGAEGTSIRLPTTMCTVAILRRRADTTIRDAAFFGAAMATAAQRMTLSTFTDNNIYWDFGGVTGANRISVTATGNITVNLEAWVAVAGVRGSAIYRNGLRLVAQTTAITRSVGTASLVVPGAASTAGDPQEIYQFLLLEQEWTPTQVMEWTVAPWGSIFEGPRRRLGRRAAAAPAPTLTQVGGPSWRGMNRGLNRGSS